MKFFQKIGNSLRQFMYGRNGADQFSLALIWIGLGVELIALIVSRWSAVVGSVIYYASAALWIWCIFRMFSKNLDKRRAENSRWLSFWWKLRHGGSDARARHADKEHKYFTCKKCKAICRVPVGKGNIVITCPKCGAQIKGKT